MSQFQRDKAIAAIGHVVQRTGASMYFVMKMMYLADKLHLERYGRFIAGDEYAALKQGPVPSHAYDLVKCVRGEKAKADGDMVVRDFFAYGQDHSLKLLRTPDLDELSDSDVECLDVVIDTYKSMGQWAVRDMSHDSAWTNAWKPGRGRNSFMMSAESIAIQLEDGEGLKAHLHDSAPGCAELN